jgi:hypothetical protein
MITGAELTKNCAMRSKVYSFGFLVSGWWLNKKDCGNVQDMHLNIKCLYVSFSFANLSTNSLFMQ